MFLFRYQMSSHNQEYNDTSHISGLCTGCSKVFRPLMSMHKVLRSDTSHVFISCTLSFLDWSTSQSVHEVISFIGLFRKGSTNYTSRRVFSLIYFALRGLVYIDSSMLLSVHNDRNRWII